ncbi:MAG: hypothetical protein AAFW00_26075 [Bacteroidota bacterium]
MSSRILIWLLCIIGWNHWVVAQDTDTPYLKLKMKKTMLTQVKAYDEGGNPQGLWKKMRNRKQGEETWALFFREGGTMTVQIEDDAPSFRSAKLLYGQSEWSVSESRNAKHVWTFVSLKDTFELKLINRKEGKFELKEPHAVHTVEGVYKSLLIQSYTYDPQRSQFMIPYSKLLLPEEEVIAWLAWWVISRIVTSEFN